MMFLLAGGLIAPFTISATVVNHGTATNPDPINTTSASPGHVINPGTVRDSKVNPKYANPLNPTHTSPEKPGRTGNSLSGRVVDTNGEPVPYASVVMKESGKGTVSDEEGYFILKNTPNQATMLQVRCLGYPGQTHEKITGF